MLKYFYLRHSFLWNARLVIFHAQVWPNSKETETDYLKQRESKLNDTLTGSHLMLK
jgi:hypothetical protein